MNHETPILVITTHGIWREVATNFKMPINMNLMRASSTGAPNYLYDKIPGSLTKLIETKRKVTRTSRSLIKSIQRELISIDETGCCSALSCAASLNAETARAYVKGAYIDETDEEEKKDQLNFIRSHAYNIVTKQKGMEMVNKSYEIKKSDDGSKLDNRMMLYINGRKPVDILRTWKNDAIQSTPADNVKIRKRRVIETTLDEILDILLHKYHIKNIIIIDLSCNLTDLMGETERDERHFIRDIDQILNPNNSTSSPASFGGKPSCKTRNCKIRNNKTRKHK